jgi:S-formylglutathione hydrolase FrmB
MGGFGAVVCGLNHTDRFGNIACFSGALDVREIAPQLPGIRMEYLFGEECRGADLKENNPFQLVQDTEKAKRPKIFVCCGEQDSLFAVNQRFYECLKQQDYDVKVFWGQGAHEFCYWNERLKDMFAWFCEKELREGFFMGRNGNDFL